jgi:heme exporter protein D
VTAAILAVYWAAQRIRARRARTAWLRQLEQRRRRQHRPGEAERIRGAA